jgi:hypothetical protein
MWSSNQASTRQKRAWKKLAIFRFVEPRALDVEEFETRDQLAGLR